MKFLCVGYYDQAKMDALSRAEVDSLMSPCPAFMEELRRSGKVPLVAGTEPEARVLRRVGSKVEVCTGPANEGRDTVGCVFLIEARDMDEAVQVALLHPTTRLVEGEHLGFRLGISPVYHFEERMHPTP